MKKQNSIKSPRDEIMNTRTFILAVLIIVLLAPNVIGADLDKKVDPQVNKKFENESKVLVIIKLRDISNISVKTDNKQLDDVFSKRSKIFQTSERDTLSSLDPSDFEVLFTFDSWNGFAGYVSSSGLEKLKNNPLVERIDADRNLYLSLHESIPLIGADSTLNLGYGGKGQSICIIDSGINYTHPALGGCLGPGCKVLDGYDFYYNTTDIMDYHGHGTHVAGIAAAYGPLNGTAPFAHIIAHKVCQNDGVVCDLAKAQKAIDRCIANRSSYNISVISMSIADNERYPDHNCENNTTLAQSINTALSYGMVVVAASGNMGWSGNMSSPACINGVISVGATYDANFSYVGDDVANCSMNNVKIDNITCFTNRNQYLDLVAPGEQIISTWYNESGYKALGGTSQATPFVAGAAAILKQVNSSLTPTDIRNILRNTGVPTVDYSMSRNNNPGTGLTFKRINIFDAVASVAFSKVLTVSNTGAGVLNVTNATGSASWIYKIEPKNFTLAANQSKNVTVTVDPRGKNNGIYSGSVVFASNDPNYGNYTVSVTMKILSQGCTGDCPPPGSGDWVID